MSLTPTTVMSARKLPEVDGQASLFDLGDSPDAADSPDPTTDRSTTDREHNE